MIMIDGISQTISFTPATYKKLSVWAIRFEDGKQAMLYKCGEEWMQHNEGSLDAHSLITIGNQIDLHLNGPINQILKNII